MASFNFVEANGKTVCRGQESTCIGIKGNYSYALKIPKGSRSLEISIWSAGGGATAYYCEVCMAAVLGRMNELLKEAK